MPQSSISVFLRVRPRIQLTKKQLEEAKRAEKAELKKAAATAATAAAAAGATTADQKKRVKMPTQAELIAREREQNWQQRLQEHGTTDLADERMVNFFHPDGRSASYEFNRCFGGKCTQRILCEEVARPVIDKTLNGYNSTILAYGQTGSGKSYTMFGTEQNPGLVPFILNRLVDAMERSQGEIDVAVSAYELYNEKLVDLLGKGTPRVRESEGVFMVMDCETRSLRCNDVLGLVREIERNRHRAETKMNLDSSRSHVVVSVQTSCQAQDDVGFCSTLSLVDLAGCENARKSGTGAAERQREMININKSLSCLKRVMEALAMSAQYGEKKQPPYRDSVLTKILRESMGGASFTTLLCNVSPEPEHATETYSTLQFGQMSSWISTVLRQNRQLSVPQLEQAIVKAEAKKKALVAGVEAVLPMLSADAAADVQEQLRKYKTSQVAKGEMECPLSGAVLRDPVTTLDGVTYERAALVAHFEKHGHMPAAPGVAARTKREPLLMFDNVALCSFFKTSNKVANLPEDILQHVGSFLLVVENRMMQVCTRWWQLCNTDSWWLVLAQRDMKAEDLQKKPQSLTWAEYYVRHLHGGGYMSEASDTAAASEQTNGSKKKKKKNKRAALSPLHGLVLCQGVEWLMRPQN